LDVEWTRADDLGGITNVLKMIGGAALCVVFRSLEFHCVAEFKDKHCARLGRSGVPREDVKNESFRLMFNCALPLDVAVEHALDSVPPVLVGS